MPLSSGREDRSGSSCGDDIRNCCLWWPEEALEACWSVLQKVVTVSLEMGKKSWIVVGATDSEEGDQVVVGSRNSPIIEGTSLF